jgi:hypothetical protein
MVWPELWVETSLGRYATLAESGIRIGGTFDRLEGGSRVWRRVTRLYVWIERRDPAVISQWSYLDQNRPPPGLGLDREDEPSQFMRARGQLPIGQKLPRSDGRARWNSSFAKLIKRRAHRRQHHDNAPSWPSAVHFTMKMKARPLLGSGLRF